ncbi:MAG: ROK family transcriptional regulator [Devosia sp.]
MYSPSHRAIVEAISTSGPLTRTELSALTGFSKASVTNLSRDLIEIGLLSEGDAIYGQGRPSVQLALDRRGGYLIGLTLAHRAGAVLVVTDLHGNVQAQRDFPWSRDPEEVGDNIAAMLPELCAEAGIAPTRIVGIGVAVPGFVDQHQQMVLQSSFMGWQDIPAAAAIEARTGIPTYVENDANAVTVGEKLFGRAKESRNFTLASLGIGIGCAHFIDGRLHRGHSGGAGELAHATMDLMGAPCRCGKRGCLTTISSARAVVNSSAEAGVECTSISELEALAERGNQSAIGIIHKAGSMLGLALSHVVQMNNPELVLVVLLDGELDGLMHRVTKQTLDACIMPRFARHTEIQFEKVSTDFWARGAAAVAAERFLSNPTKNTILIERATT